MILTHHKGRYMDNFDGCFQAGWQKTKVLQLITNANFLTILKKKEAGQGIYVEYMPLLDTSLR
jgi:hypothetical protein